MRGVLLLQGWCWVHWVGFQRTDGCGGVGRVEECSDQMVNYCACWAGISGHMPCVLECIGMWHTAQVSGAVGKCSCEYEGDCPRSVSEGLQKLHELVTSQLVSLFVCVLLGHHSQHTQGFHLLHMIWLRLSQVRMIMGWRRTGG